MTDTRAFQLVQEALDSLQRVGLLREAVVAQPETVLLGAGSPLDSIGFVTFITEMEDRMSREAQRELYLVLKDIHEFNADSPYLSAGTLARYIAKISNS
jgi:hypothetical protein